MSWRKIKRDRADHYFSLFIRYRDNWQCQFCLKVFEPVAANLHASHFYSRGRESTRFDPVNVDAICSFDHENLGKNPAEYAAWKLKQLGRQRYDALMVRANLHCKRDRKLAAIAAKQLYLKEKKRFENSRKVVLSR